EYLSETEMMQVKQKEGERILSKLSDDTHVVTLAIEGMMKSSEQLATDFENLATYGKSKIAFVIGGALGLSMIVMTQATDTLSFSKITFPHQLMRLILVEQIYRAFRIIRNEPYHK